MNYIVPSEFEDVSFLKIYLVRYKFSVTIKQKVSYSGVTTSSRFDQPG